MKTGLRDTHVSWMPWVCIWDMQLKGGRHTLSVWTLRMRSLMTCEAVSTRYPGKRYPSACNSWHCNIVSAVDQCESH